MLKEILAAIASDKRLSRRKLAAESGIAEPVLDQAIRQLIRMGYLADEELETGCAASCFSCPMAARCGSSLLTSYQITEKGRQLLAEIGQDTE